MNNIDLINQISSQTSSKISQTFQLITLQDSTYFYEANQKNIKDLLTSKKYIDVLKALKIIIAFLIQGKSIDQYIHLVIQQLANPDQEIKTYSKHIIQEFNCCQKQHDLLIMSITSLHREVLSNNIFLRGTSFQTLTNIYHPDILGIIMGTQKKIVIDKSAYVRRISVQSFAKILVNQEQDEINDIVQFLKFFLQDLPFVKGLAIIILNETLDNSLQWLHPYFRKIVKDLNQYTIFDLPKILDILSKYCQIYLSFFKNSQDQTLKEDLNIFLENCEQIIMINSPSIVLKISEIFLLFGNKNQIQKAVKYLLKFLNMSSETKFILLQQLEKIAVQFPNILEDKYQYFFIVKLEKQYCKIIKIQILSQIINDFNFVKIIDELYYNARIQNDDIQKMCIQFIGEIGLRDQKYLMKCTKMLMFMLKSNKSKLIDEIIIQLSLIIKKDKNINLPILVQCCKLIPQINSQQAKSSIIELLYNQITIIPSFIAELIRNLTSKFVQQQSQIKILLKLISLKLIINLQDNEDIRQTVLKFLLFMIQLSTFDQDIKLLQLNPNDLYVYTLEQFDQNKSKIIEYDFDLHIFQLCHNSQEQINKISQFKMGSLSKQVGYNVKGSDNYPVEICEQNTNEQRNSVESIQLNEEKKHVARQVIQQDPIFDKTQDNEEKEIEFQKLEEQLDSFFRNDNF